MDDSGLGNTMCKMSLEHFVVFKSIEVLGEERKKAKKEDRHHIPKSKMGLDREYGTDMYLLLHLERIIN